MIRYHIGRDGRPAECHARPGNCPVKMQGVESMPHFETPELASQWYETHREDDVSTMTSGFSFSYEPLDEDLFMDDLSVPDVKIDELGQEIPSNTMTMAEENAVEAIKITEGEIMAHQDAIKRGAKPIDLYHDVEADDLSKQFLDMREYKRAFLNGDYDKARLMASRAAKRAYDYVGTIYFDDEELITRAQKAYNREYGID